MFTLNRGELFEELVEAISSFQIVEEVLEGTRVPRNTGTPLSISGSRTIIAS
jgi:hypothetical protein